MNQKGAALPYAMLAIVLSSAVLLYVTRMFSNREVETIIYEKEASRDQLARNIELFLTNPQVILQSVDPSIDLPGNAMLRDCVGNPSGTMTTSTYTSATGVSGNACDSTKVDSNLGMEFLLFPETSYVFGNAVGDSNCPSSGQSLPWKSRSMSCFLAGMRNPGQYVAYNFKGDTNGVGNQDFPLRVRVFFKPVCSKRNPAQTSCAFAEAIQFRYEISEVYTKFKRFKLGTYPRKPQWISVDTLTIVGMQCNIGAVASADALTGTLACKCFRPYRPLLDPSTSLPQVNAKGPLCESEEIACPPGFILVGHDNSSNPICQQMITKTASTAGPSWSSSDPPSTHSCNQNGDGGWVSNITRTCTATDDLTYNECPQGCGSNSNLAIILGLVSWFAAFIISLMIFIAVAIVLLMSFSLFSGPLIAEAFMPTLGMLFNLVIMVPSMIGILGAVGGFLLGQSWDWIYASSAGGQHPIVICDVKLECGKIE